MMRLATLADVPAIHTLGCAIPELKVSAVYAFMTPDELASCIASGDGVFLVSEQSGPGGLEIAGFAYSAIGDLDRGQTHEQACFVYLAVEKEWRHRNIGAELYDEMIDRLRARGVGYVYTWADSGIVAFMARRGFHAGKACVWMDRTL